ncbi:hypothetical protein DE146DRAFT_164356 [Phaeosphaeria sp. MPI-PUGE-AT-0046c]|nr:hypothetical protein DE146DRAFT_164356 [Phaeosphaeria sp. MPI-PUGE-AT-0046c]
MNVNQEQLSNQPGNDQIPQIPQSPAQVAAHETHQTALPQSVAGLHAPVQCYLLNPDTIHNRRLPDGCPRCGRNHRKNSDYHKCPAEFCQNCPSVSFAHHGFPCPKIAMTYRDAQLHYRLHSSNMPINLRYMRFIPDERELNVLVAAGLAIKDKHEYYGFSFTDAAHAIFNASARPSSPANEERTDLVVALSLSQDRSVPGLANKTQISADRGGPAYASGSSARSGLSWRGQDQDYRYHDEEERQRRDKRREDDLRERVRLERMEEDDRRDRLARERREEEDRRDARVATEHQNKKELLQLELQLQLQIAANQQVGLYGAPRPAIEPSYSGGPVFNQPLAVPSVSSQPQALSRPSQTRTDGAGGIQKPYIKLRSLRGSSRARREQSSVMNAGASHSLYGDLQLQNSTATADPTSPRPLRTKTRSQSTKAVENPAESTDAVPPAPILARTCSQPDEVEGLQLHGSMTIVGPATTSSSRTKAGSTLAEDTAKPSKRAAQSRKKKGRGRKAQYKPGERPITTLDMFLFVPSDKPEQLLPFDNLPDDTTEHLKQTLNNLYERKSADHDKYARMTDPSNHDTYISQEPDKKCIAHWLFSNGSGGIHFKDGDAQRACNACTAQPLRPCVRMEVRSDSTVLVFYPRPDRVLPAECTWRDIEYWLSTGRVS